MLQNLINNNLYGEVILLFLMIAYIFMRYIQRKTQKNNNWNNFEFWLFYNLVDYFKYNGYPYPEIRAKTELNRIIELKNKECQKVIIDEAEIIK